MARIRCGVRCAVGAAAATLAALAWRLATFFCEANWLAVGALSIPSSSSSSGAVRVFSQGVQNSDGEQIQPPGFWRATGGDHGPSTAISDMGFCTARIGFCFSCSAVLGVHKRNRRRRICFFCGIVTRGGINAKVVAVHVLVVVALGAHFRFKPRKFLEVCPKVGYEPSSWG